jgi:hypothetical protein
MAEKTQTDEEKFKKYWHQGGYQLSQGPRDSDLIHDVWHSRDAEVAALEERIRQLEETLTHVLATDNFIGLDRVRFDGKSIRQHVVSALAAGKKGT